jgi:beta-lactamase regulating signal transducer with metallopeptidase domain
MSLAVLGWTVVHSLWQWTIVAGVAALVLGLLRGKPPQRRHVTAWIALALMMLCSIATFWMATVTFDQSPRHRALYAFDGMLMIPEVVPHGATILRATALLWCAGMLAYVVRLGADWRRLRRLEQGPAWPADADCTNLKAELQRQMNLPGVVALHFSSRVTAPMVIGWRRPRILLPASVSQQLTTEEMRAVLAHELAHVRRGDLGANLGQAFVELVLFHHPGARWLSRRVRIEREYCCDDIALGVAGDPVTYARALATLEDARCDSRLAAAAASGTLLDRVQRILDQPRPMLTPARGALACVVALLLAASMLAVALNVPPPWVPAGVRMRRPPPPGTVVSPPAARPQR